MAEAGGGSAAKLVDAITSPFEPVAVAALTNSPRSVPPTASASPLAPERVAAAMELPHESASQEAVEVAITPAVCGRASATAARTSLADFATLGGDGFGR